LQQRALFRLLLVIRLEIAKSKNKKSLELWFVNKPDQRATPQPRPRLTDAMKEKGR
jgi:hypothetical protein